MTIDSVLADYEAGKSPEDVLTKVFARIAAVDDPGIFIHLANKEDVLAAVDSLGPRDPEAMPLWGVPFAVKDNIDVAGMPTTAACPAYAYIPDQDATVVAMLKAAGAVVIGKTNLDQFATGLVGTRTPYPIPKNALDPDLVPGGSSSGSAVSVAQGIVPFALGTDTAGSGRVPAGLNAITGLKPSLGALSTLGVVPACRTLDCVSIFATSIADARQIFDLARGFDAQDPYSKPWEASVVSQGRALRIGVPAKVDRKFFGDDAAREAYEATLSTLADVGAEISEVPFQTFYDMALMLYEGPWVAERYAAIDAFMETNEADLHPVTRAITVKARNFSATDTFKGIYKLAELRRGNEMLIEGLDMLCVPTAPTWYTVEENLADPIRTNANLGTYTNFVNLMGLCGLAVPTGTQSDGRPSSVTFLARAGGDHMLADFTDGFMSGAGNGSDTAPASAKPAENLCEGIEIAVVGAHLKGLPLNGELTALDAVFRRRTETLADYRLYELEGASPRKPGLLRVSPGTGHTIEIEIWSLDPAAFGLFVSRIPAPLCLGTVQLADGTQTKGFIVESEGVKDARDISDFGGWRNYVARAEEGAVA